MPLPTPHLTFPLARRRRPRPRTWVALVVTASLVGAACGGSGTKDHEADPKDPTVSTVPTCAVTKPPGDTDRVTIHAAEAFDPQAEIAASDLVTQFNTEHPKIKVVLDHADNQAAIDQRFASDVGGKGTLPALIVLDGTQNQFAADSGALIPAATCIKASHFDNTPYLPAARSYYTSGTTQLAGSANLTAPLLYYDRTAFKKAGLDPDKPPATLDETYADAVKLKAADPTSLPLSMTLSPWWVETWLSGTQTTIVNNNNGRAKRATAGSFANGKSTAVYEWLQKMVAGGLIDPVPDLPNQHQPLVDLATGLSAMIFDSSTAITSVDQLTSGSLDPTSIGLAKGTELPSPGTDLNIDAAPIPGLEEAGRGQISGSGWYLSNTIPPDEQSAAWTFLTWWNQVPAQASWTLDGSALPYNTKTVNDAQLEQVWQNTQRGHWIDTAYTETTNIDPTFPGPSIGPYAQVRTAIGKSLSDVVVGMKPADAAAEVDQSIDLLLAQYNLTHP